MSLLDRQTLMKIHALIAALILPVALMFFVTGALYTWGVKGSYETTVHTIELEQALQPQLHEMQAIVIEKLDSLALAAPTGNAKVKQLGTSFSLEWTGSNRDVILEPTQNLLTAELKIKDTSWYRNFVQLHKAKGGTLFKVYAAFLASALLVLLLSGFVMAWKTPRLRKASVIASAVGIATFVCMVALS